MTGADFKLFPFQEEAAASLRSAALNWVSKSAEVGRPKYGATPIPFIGQLKAITGAGKTPVLADVIAGLGPAVVIWTTKSAAVVEQTFQKLRGVYSPLLPKDVRVIRVIPSQADWVSLLESKSGLTIWVLTTAQWNEAESAMGAGDEAARLSLHRPQPDWSDSEFSPWELLRTRLKRPLWIVSDESHNQSSVQLDQLTALRPVGFFLASATPIQNELFGKWNEALKADSEWNTLVSAGVVPVRTRDVVAAELLKTTIELWDNNSGLEEDLDGVLGTMAELDEAVSSEEASILPKAIYVVEQSNPRRGSTEEARPLVIWRYLRQRGIPAEEIAIYTQTKELPEEAQKISSLSQLSHRHRHIIFNQALQEGWDDPEAYVCYFDGVTKSFTRIRQIVGRILRQPKAQRYSSERLNTATVYINVPTDEFDAVLRDLKEELRLYAPEDEPSSIPIKVRTKKNPLQPIVVKAESANLSLPRRTLKAPNMSSQERKIESRGASLWSQEFLLASGTGLKSVLSLQLEEVERTEMLEILRSARTPNGVYLRRRMLARNRACVNAVHPDSMNGPAYAQESCQNSSAQEELTNLANSVAEYFEDRVSYQIDPDPDRADWIIGEHRPRTSELIEFSNAAHQFYSKGDFNADELQFARALDQIGRGVWARNPSSGELGYSIPLPIKAGDSTRFYPDFLWWVDDRCWAIDTTGKHLLDEKVRGKLVGIEPPRTALVVKGKVDVAKGIRLDRLGWTLVVARPGLTPLVDHSEDLGDLLRSIADLTF
jgi:type III restriction enzyme